MVIFSKSEISGWNPGVFLNVPQKSFRKSCQSRTPYLSAASYNAFGATPVGPQTRRILRFALRVSNISSSYRCAFQLSIISITQLPPRIYIFRPLILNSRSAEPIYVSILRIPRKVSAAAFMPAVVSAVSFTL